MYVSGKWNDATKQSSFSNNRHPSPYDDTDLRNALSSNLINDPHYGFSSLKQFKQWVHKAQWRRGLNNVGVQLSVYQVDYKHLKKGKYQAIFDISKANIVKVLRPDFLDCTQVKTKKQQSTRKVIKLAI
jgi:hypothetical protein